MSPYAQRIARGGRALAATFAVAVALTSAGVATRSAGTSEFSVRSVVNIASVAAAAASDVHVMAKTSPLPVAGTLVAEPAPAPAPSAAPVAAAPAVAPRAAAPVAARVAAAPVASNPRNLLTSGDGTLHAGVTVYSDCSGRTALTLTAAAIDTCIGGRTFFVGHNPGLFTPLMHMNAGATITWFDGNGVAHNLRIVAVRVWQHVGMPPAPIDGATVQFQTCINSAGTVNRLLDAVAV